MKPPAPDSDRTAANLDRDLRVRAALAGCFMLAVAVFRRNPAGC